jgi:hypothetical protein
MRIIVRRSGGFAGTAETLHDIDTDNLDAASAAEVENLVKTLDAAARTDGAQAQPVGADFIKYEVTLSYGQGQRTVSIVEDNSARLVPVHRLLNYLSTLRR